jgi:hypothetical protein
MFGRFPQRYDAARIAAIDIDTHDDPTFNQSQGNHPRFAIIETIVFKLDRRLMKQVFRCSERKAMLVAIDTVLAGSNVIFMNPIIR